MQETLVKAYVHWRRVRSADDPRAYVRRILVRCHLDAARSPRRRELSSGSAGDVAPERRDSRDAFAGVDDRLFLLVALERLTPKQRAVLVLRFIEDVDVAGTAAALGVSEGTVKSSTHDALRALRERWAADESTAGGRR